MVDHSHIPKQCPMILVYLGSEIHRDGIGWNQKNQKKAFTASCLAAPKKCLQNSTHVHAGMECRDSFKQSDCQAKACPHLRHRACSPALLPSVFFLRRLGHHGCHSKSSTAESCIPMPSAKKNP